jgi:C4-dicarboxylate-specific signal transduction histidine kinase
LSDFVVPALRARIEERIRTDDASTTEVCCLRKDGSTFQAEIRIRILKEDGRTIRVTALRDLTEEHAAAAKIRAQRAELEATRRLALVSEISAGIIHQLTQPLTSISVNLMLATTKQQACRCQTCEAEGPLAEAEKEVTRMREIIKHLRSLDNPAESPRVDMDLNAVIIGTTPLLQPGAESLNIALGIELADNLPPVAMDWVQMSQVVINLTRNAFDACADCPPERRVVTIRTRSLGGGGLEMSVCDTGSGIAPDALERLFCPLFTTKVNGLGIGLRLSQTIVQAHGGTLAGENNHDGRGATFRVVLPLKNPRYTKV